MCSQAPPLFQPQFSTGPLQCRSGKDWHLYRTGYHAWENGTRGYIKYLWFCQRASWATCSHGSNFGKRFMWDNQWTCHNHSYMYILRLSTYSFMMLWMSSSCMERRRLQQQICGQSSTNYICKMIHALLAQDLSTNSKYYSWVLCLYLLSMPISIELFPINRIYVGLVRQHLQLKSMVNIQSLPLKRIKIRIATGRSYQVSATRQLLCSSVNYHTITSMIGTDNFYRVCLKSTPGSDYINASFIDVRETVQDTG